MWGHEIIIDGRTYGHSRLAKTKAAAAKLMKSQGIKGEPIKCPEPTLEQKRDNPVY
jgi:hypothetical protein